MSNDQESVILLQRWKDGDEEAAQEIFSRYVSRLAGLARCRLSEKMQRRVDPDDIVQSVYRSFFGHAKGDRYELKRSGDLWRLLAGITVNKTLGQVEHHRAAKRTIDVEVENLSDGSSVQISPELLAREPTVEEAIIFSDEVENLMKQLEPIERQCFEMRLQDMSTADIAEKVDCSPRTVRRVIERVKVQLAFSIENSPD